MRPTARFSRASAWSGVDKPKRTSQGCSKATEAAKLRPSQLAQLDGSDAAVACSSPNSVLSAACQSPTQSPAWCPAVVPPLAADSPLDPDSSALGQLPTLLDAGRLLSGMLDALALSLLGRQPVPDEMDSILSSLFPAAASITATLPSPDGQALAVASLLTTPPTSPRLQHPVDLAGTDAAAAAFEAAPTDPAAEAAASAACAVAATVVVAEAGAVATAAPAPEAPLIHTEPLGSGGLCCFHLPQPPSDTAVGLMRAFSQELAARLRREAAAAAAAELSSCGTAGIGRAHTTLASGTPAEERIAYAYTRTAPSACGMMLGQVQPDSMPADCFWMSV